MQEVDSTDRGCGDPGKSFAVTRRDGTTWTVWVSVDDYERVMAAGEWSIHTHLCLQSAYVKRLTKVDGKRRTKSLQEFVLGRVDGMMVDHRDCDGLNNRRSNLRHATVGQNAKNRPLHRNNTSGYKGVTRRGSKWKAFIKSDGVGYSLGVFANIEDAAMAYAGANMLLHGEFGRLE